MEALQTATLNPARYFDKLKDMGTIEPGKLADLVLLNANPLDDIRNTRKISLVVLRGRVVQ
jgi:imidazolonepropionase-like amidohydrolase